MNTDAAKRLENRVECLEEQLSSQASQTRRRTLVIGLLGSVVIAVATLSFLRITNASRQFDAEAVTRIGRAEIEERLPQAATAMGDKLESEAPRIVDQTVDRLASQIPNLRAHLLGGLNQRFDDLTAKFEERMLAVTSSAIEESKRRLDEAYPDKSDAEKFELMMAEISARFEENFSDASNELYPQYAAQVRRIRDELVDIRSKDPGAMPRRERLRREILETMVELTDRSIKPPQ